MFFYRVQLHDDPSRHQVVNLANFDELIVYRAVPVGADGKLTERWKIQAIKHLANGDDASWVIFSAVNEHEALAELERIVKVATHFMTS